MRHTGILFFLFALSAGIGGCFGGDGELRFRDAGGVAPAARAEAEIRMYKNGFDRWDFPALPGSLDAARRERRDPTRGNSLFLRAEFDLTSVVVDGGDFSPWLEYLYAIPLDPGPVRSRMRVTQGELLLRAGWCTRGQFLRLGGGLSGAVVNLSGSVRDADTRIPIGETAFCFGPGALLEISPGFPPLRAYLDVRILPWFHDGRYGSLEVAEVGVKVRYLGFLLFGGYRWQTVERDPDDLILTYRHRGAVMGLGLSF